MARLVWPMLYDSTKRELRGGILFSQLACQLVCVLCLLHDHCRVDRRVLLAGMSAVASGPRRPALIPECPALVAWQPSPLAEAVQDDAIMLVMAGMRRNCLM